MQHKPSTHSRLIIVVLFTFCSFIKSQYTPIFFISLFFMARPSIARTCHLVVCSLNINNLFFVVAYDLLILINYFWDLIKYWVYNFLVLMADRICTNVVHTIIKTSFLQLILTLGMKYYHLLHQYKSPNNTQDNFVSEFSFIFNRYLNILSTI